MNRRSLLLLWIILVGLVVAGLFRLRFDTEVLDLLPPELTAVQGLKLYQQNFSNARELIITVRSHSAETAEAAARAIAENLSQPGAPVASVAWQPPWLEHPAQAAELIGYLWFNQPPPVFGELTNRLAATNLPALLASTREQLAMSMSPNEIAQLSYDPFALMKLPEAASGAAPSFAQGNEMFANSNGTFRIIFVKANHDLATFRECDAWLTEIKQRVQQVRTSLTKNPVAADASPLHLDSKKGQSRLTSAATVEGSPRVSPAGGEGAGTSDSQNKITIGYTGRPAFVSEIAAGMQHDIQISVIGTSVIIAILFYIAHRRVKPMLWLLTLLALILGGTLALGGLIFGAINVVSMGFAAILLGLAVDYAVVHYQEALAHPDLSVPQIRRAIAPSIFWAAITTICAFLVLNLGGLPGLAQLGTLVGVGVALAAIVMIFAFLPPLFPDRRQPRADVPASFATHQTAAHQTPTPTPRRGTVTAVFAGTLALVLFTIISLLSGIPKMDPTANALRPRDSAAYSTADEIKNELSQTREPLWVIVSGADERQIGARLDAVKSTLDTAVSNNVLKGFVLPNALWPRPANQSENRSIARQLAAEEETLHSAAVSNGFSETAIAMTKEILTTWRQAASSTGVFWPTNQMSRWIFDKLVARTSTNLFALGLLYPAPATSNDQLNDLQSRLESAVNSPNNSESPPANRQSAIGNHQSVWLSGWELLGSAILSSVMKNLWKLVAPIVVLVLLSLWLAFRRAKEVLLSISILVLSGFCLLAAMRLAGWSWNLLNLMALPLILGTGVDYSIFMQLALRRYHGDIRMAYRSVGRALLLCGGTAISGFGALGFSSNQGMASLGQVCAVGIACNVVISVLLLPVWWKKLSRSTTAQTAT